MALRIVTICGPVVAAKPRVGALQREQRELDVAGELQLLARARQDLLDFSEGPVVAIARQILILLLQRLALRLCVRELALELDDLRVDGLHGTRGLIGLGAQSGGLRVARLQALRELRVALIELAVEHEAAHARHHHDDHQHQPHSAVPAPPPRCFGCDS